MKLSIITINYNNASGLEDTIKSVITQTWQDFEYIVIDGGSTDGSKEIIQSYTDKISYWVSESDKGIYNAMNKGILKAKGEYLLFLNSGDTLYNRDVLNNIFATPYDQDIIYGNMHRVFPDGTTDIANMPFHMSIPYLLSATLAHPVTFIKRSLFQKYGLYREDLKIVSDWAFFVKIFAFDKVSQIHIPTTISSFRVDGLSSLEENQTLVNAERSKVIAEDFYTELLAAYDDYSKYKTFYNKSIFLKLRKLAATLKKIIGR